jgi:pimeloyl-ACP methyl ester carboxylesterase
VGRVGEVSLAAALAPDFTVFAYDRRGRGDRRNTAAYAVEWEVEDLDALIDGASGSAFVFGHSSGAMLAQDTALLLPNKITTLALYEPPFIVDDSPPPIPKGFRGAPSGVGCLRSTGRRGRILEYRDWYACRDDCLDAARALVADLEGGGTHAPVRRHHQARHSDTRSVIAPELGVRDGPHPGDGQHHDFRACGPPRIHAPRVRYASQCPPHAQWRILEGQDHGPSDDVLAPVLQELFLG